MPRETLVEGFYCDFAGNPLGDVIDPRNGRIAVPQGRASTSTPTLG